MQHKGRGSSWNPNQRDLATHGNKHHYKTMEKNTLYRIRG